MKFTFWGVRGSFPSPLTNADVQAKITAIVQRIEPKDLESPDARTRFLASLPPWLFGTVGGNTACVELDSDSGKQVLLDAGTGLAQYSKRGVHPENKEYHIFLSHFHWDHIQGFPFFGPSFNPKAKIHIYSHFPDAARYFSEQSRPPFFPINGSWDAIKNQLHFHLLETGTEYLIQGFKVCSHKMKHPGDSYAYSFEENGKKFIYATDSELRSMDFDKNIADNSFFKNADVIVFDSQYTSSEAMQKEDWGHSSFSKAIDFASFWGIKKLYFFHHEPFYDDKKIFSNYHSGKIYQDYLPGNDVQVYVAQEAKDYEL